VLISLAPFDVFTLLAVIKADIKVTELPDMAVLSFSNTAGVISAFNSGCFAAVSLALDTTCY